MSNGKIILDLCGGTGAWSRPYKEAGYDVRLVTLPDNNVLTYEPPDGVYGILAAPPCTEFSVAKYNKPRDYENAIKVVEACYRIIWKCRIKNKLAFWAMENPRGQLRQFIGKPAFTFEQWQFGDSGVKPTDVWGWFNTPKYTVTERPAGLVKEFPNGRTNGANWGSCEPPEWYSGAKLNRAGIRAITPPGFAQAFFEANK